MTYSTTAYIGRLCDEVRALPIRKELRTTTNELDEVDVIATYETAYVWSFLNAFIIVLNACPFGPTSYVS